MWGTIHEQATKETVFEPIGQSLDTSEPTHYRIGEAENIQMLGGIDLQELLFVLVPLVLLLCWLLSLYLGKYRTNLLVSMLLVLWDIPYTLGLLAVVSGRGMFGLTAVSLPLVFGLICFLVGIVGIIAYVRRL